MTSPRDTIATIGSRRGVAGLASARRRRRSDSLGFTLIEALAAVTVMGIVLAALGAITGQWLPNWNRGFMRVQRGELFSVALDRLADDLASAEFVTANRDTKMPLFDGTPTGLIMVRSAIGPNTEPGLEIVRIAEGTDRQGLAMVRMRTPFRPFGAGDILPAAANQLPFADPVVLLRAPFRVAFSYSNGDGVWQDTWRQADKLPATVRFLVRDTTTNRTIAISSAAMVHVNLQAGCADGSGGAAAPGAAPPGASGSQQQVAGNPPAGLQQQAPGSRPGTGGAGSTGCGGASNAAPANAAPGNGAGSRQ